MRRLISPVAILLLAMTACAPGTGSDPSADEPTSPATQVAVETQTILENDSTPTATATLVTVPSATVPASATPQPSATAKPSPTVDPTTTPISPEATETVEVAEDLTPVEILDERSVEVPIVDHEGNELSPQDTLVEVRLLTDSFDQWSEEFPYVERFSPESLWRYNMGLIRLNALNHGYDEFVGDSTDDYINNVEQTSIEQVPPKVVHGIDVQTGEYIAYRTSFNNPIKYYVEVGPTFGHDRVNTFQLSEESPELPMWYLTGGTNREIVKGIYIDTENDQVIVVERMPIIEEDYFQHASFRSLPTSPYRLIALPKEVHDDVHTIHERNENLVGRNLIISHREEYSAAETAPIGAILWGELVRKNEDGTNDIALQTIE